MMRTLLKAVALLGIIFLPAIMLAAASGLAFVLSILLAPAREYGQ